VNMILHARDLLIFGFGNISGQRSKAVSGNMDNIFVKEKFPNHLLFE